MVEAENKSKRIELLPLALLAFLIGLVFGFIGCADNVAPVGSTLQILPAAVSLDEDGTVGDETYVNYAVLALDPDDNPISDIQITVGTFFLELIDIQTGERTEDNLVLTTDDNGYVYFAIPAPLAVEYIDTITVRTGGIAAESELSAAAAAQ